MDLSDKIHVPIRAHRSDHKLLRFIVLFAVTKSHLLVVTLPILLLFTTYQFMRRGSDSRQTRQVDATDVCIGRPVGCLNAA